MASKPPFTEHRIPQEQGKLYARDYDAFSDGAYIVAGGFLIVLFAALFATRSDQQ